ncbi:Bromodomain transcription factor [Phaffia rhodozyma]|uniref:Bromodomain transcription factor n=1 Tax=Phaffia rhodozyma TaxID=264483 RepID=A0A0F7SL70_PHARH|nr:Bromodomain transcription factor [Phaffia rhodozyma]
MPMPHPSALPLHILRLIALHHLAQHGFSASHAQASLALTDVLARFLSLLSSESGSFAESAGRTQVSLQDGIACVESLGISVGDLEAVWRGDDRSRVESAIGLKHYLNEGLDLDTSDHQHYIYTDVPPELETLSPSGRKRSASDAFLVDSLSDQSEAESDEQDEDEDEEKIKEGQNVSVKQEEKKDVEMDGGSGSSDEEDVSTPFGGQLSEGQKPKIFTSEEPSFAEGIKDEGEIVDEREEWKAETLREVELGWVQSWKKEENDGPYGRLSTFLPPLPSEEAYDPIPLSTPGPLSGLAMENDNEDGNGSLTPSLEPVLLEPLHTSLVPSFLHPSAFSSSSSTTVLPTLSNDPPAPLTTSSAPTFKALKAAHASLPPPQTVSYLSRNPNKPRVRAAYLLSLVSNPPENYSPTSSLFSSVPVPAPRSTGIVPTLPTDPNVSLPPGALKSKPTAGHLPTSALYPSTPHRYPALLSSLARHMGNPGLVARTTNMPYPAPLIDKGNPKFYGLPRVGRATIVKPVEVEEGEEPEEGEEIRLEAKSLDVELKATWDAPIRDWTDTELPFQRKRPPPPPKKEKEKVKE